MSCHYSDWHVEARQIGFELCRQRKRHSAIPVLSRFAMIDSSAGNRNPVPPIIPVIDEALGRLLFFPIGYQRGLLHSSEIDLGESAVGQPRHFGARVGTSASHPIGDISLRRTKI